MKNLLLLAALSAISAPALCADNGFYTGTSLGHASVGSPIPGPLTKSGDNVFGGFIGYRLNDNFGVEGAYTGIGRYRSATQSGKADALSVAAVGYMPLSDKFELLGKLGLADAIGKSGTGGLENTNRIGPMVGVGLQYNVSDSVGLRLGVDRYEAAVKDLGVSRHYNANVVAATFVYRF